MIEFGRWKKNRATMVAGAVSLLALGAAGGAGAVQATRPPVVMAPIVRTPIAKLRAINGIVTVKGRVAEIYGDRLVVQDQTGRAMIAVSREAGVAVGIGQPVTVQGRYDDGQLRATFLVSQSGRVAAVGPAGPPKEGPGPHIRPGPHGGPDGASPPPPPGCAYAPRDAGVVPPPPPPTANGAAPPPPPLSAAQIPPDAPSSATATASRIRRD